MVKGRNFVNTVLMMIMLGLALPAQAVMIRPDRYILGTARTEAELRALCTTVQDFT